VKLNAIRPTRLLSAIASVTGIIVICRLSLTWFPLPANTSSIGSNQSIILPSRTYNLHREEGGGWKDSEIVTDYIEWKIARQERTTEDGIHKILVVWRANFRNTSDKKRRLAITFQLLDKDNLLIGTDEEYAKAMADDKEAHDNSWQLAALDPTLASEILPGLYERGKTYLLPKQEKVVEGKFEIDKTRAASAYKGDILLSAVEEELSERELRAQEEENARAQLLDEWYDSLTPRDREEVSKDAFVAHLESLTIEQLRKDYDAYQHNLETKMQFIGRLKREKRMQRLFQ